LSNAASWIESSSPAQGVRAVPSRPLGGDATGEWAIMSKKNKTAKDALPYVRIYADLWNCPTFASLTSEAQMFFFRLCSSYHGGDPYHLTAPYKLFSWGRSRIAKAISELLAKNVIIILKAGGRNQGEGCSATTYRLTEHFNGMMRFGQKNVKQWHAVSKHPECTTARYRPPQRKTTNELMSELEKNRAAKSQRVDWPVQPSGLEGDGSVQPSGLKDGDGGASLVQPSGLFLDSTPEAFPIPSPGSSENSDKALAEPHARAGSQADDGDRKVRALELLADVCKVELTPRKTRNFLSKFQAVSDDEFLKALAAAHNGTARFPSPEDVKRQLAGQC
jgi:hypothetical protein